MEHRDQVATSCKVEEEESIATPRGPIGVALQHSKWAIAGEIVFITLLPIVVTSLISQSPTPSFDIGNVFIIPISTPIRVALIFLSLWLRGLDFRAIGLKRPVRWWPIILLGIGGSVVMFFEPFTSWIFDLLKPLIGVLPPENLGVLSNLAGHNVPALLGWLTVTWTVAAFGEEITDRGYLLTRLTDLFGKSWLGWGLSLLIAAAIFASGHAYQGPKGIIDTVVGGLIFGILYLIARRNLWAGIIAHGINDTCGIILVFLTLP
jgi:uncharacterized protein